MNPGPLKFIQNEVLGYERELKQKERERKKLPLQERKLTKEFSHGFQAQIAIVSRNFHENISVVNCRQFLQERIRNDVFPQGQLKGLENFLCLF
jgi:hypothetical protein